MGDNNNTQVVFPEIKQLYSAINFADDMVFSRYVDKLSDAECIPVRDDVKKIEFGQNVILYKIERLVYDKKENIQDKLTTVYSSINSLGDNSLVMLLKGEISHAEIYIGVSCNDFEVINGKTYISKGLEKSAESLKCSMIANFPGSQLTKVKTEDSYGEKGKKSLIFDCFSTGKYITGVSSIPALRNESERKSEEFVQGLEKFIDTMRGKKYTAVIIGDVLSNEQIEEKCKEYENIYSQLSPFKQSVESLNSTEGKSNSKGLIKGITNSINNSTTRTITDGTSASKSSTNTVGGSVGVGFSAATPPILGGLSKTVNVSVNYSHSATTTNGTSHSESNSVTSGTSRAESEQKSITNTVTNTQGESKQITFENRSVASLMARIDEQIKRMRNCEDFGMFNTCAYFVSEDYSAALSAASIFKSLTRGANSSVEASCVNIWQDENKVDTIKEYLERFYHPCFNHPNIEINVDNKKSICPVTPALTISGKEMAFEIALPKKSVSGIPVVSCAEFGRDVISYNKRDEDKKIKLGKIYHMNCEEETDVCLSMKSLASHTFITGSTGAGKSNTVYRILKESCKKGTHFLVVEPAKGEYKDVFGNEKNVSVYGTNPSKTPLLRINPFSFPEDIHVLEHLDRLVEIFNVCWPMYAAMPAVLKNAVEKSYEDCGWDLISSTNEYGDSYYPSFADVARNVRKIIDSSDYDTENKGAYKGSLLTRLQSLTNGINGMIFTSDEISDSDLFDKNVIVDISRVGSSETKSLIMGMLVLKLQEYRMASRDELNAELKHITVLEEAHNLLKRSSGSSGEGEGGNLAGKSVEMISNAIAEMRTYGEGFIIADQAPALLDMAAIRNTNTKIIMRLPDQADRELVGKAANLNDDQISELAKLMQGVAAVYQNEWIQPVLCKVAYAGGGSGKYKFNAPKAPDKSMDYSAQLEIAELIINEDYITDDHKLQEIKDKMKSICLSPYIQVSVIKVLTTPPSCLSVTKYAPIMEALFPTVSNTIKEKINESSDPADWTVSAISALEECIRIETDSTFRTDIIQALMVNYLIIEKNNNELYSEWSERGRIS